MITMEWFDPQRFAKSIGHGISDELVNHMLDNPRLKRRCMELVEARFGQAAPSPVQAAMLALDRSGLKALALRAGAVWHGCSIVRLIDGAAIRELVAVIGPQLRLCAIRHFTLAPEVSETIPVSALPEAIAVAGRHCLSAWCSAQATAIARRMALRLPTDEPAQEPYLLFGPGIVDVLLTSSEER
jgi:YOP proteins translocation protein K (YscK)